MNQRPGLVSNKAQESSQLSGKWRQAKVSELQNEGILLVEDGNHGEYRPRPDEFVDAGVAFIRAADLDDGRVLFGTASKISRKARLRITKGIGSPGDVLLSHKGTVGKVAMVPADAPPFVCSPQTTFWRTLAPEVLDAGYLFSFLRSPAFRTQLAARRDETDMAPYVSLTSQRNLILTLPTIQEQRAIAHILGTLDDKIELNRRMNETLEAVARALFKSWFVDFDPVRAKAEGRDPGLPSEIADLFPDSFQDTELGEIPTGWSIRSVGELLSVVGGGTPSTKQSTFWDKGDLHWATPKDLSVLEAPILLDTERKVTAVGLRQIGSGLLPAGTVLMSSRAPIGYLAMSAVPTAINQGFIGIMPNENLPSSYTLNWCYANLEQIKQRAGGTTFAEISKSVFRTLSMWVPTRDIVQCFSCSVDPLYAKIRNNLEQFRILATMRDLLLPRLVSGTMRASEERA